MAQVRASCGAQNENRDNELIVEFFGIVVCLFIYYFASISTPANGNSNNFNVKCFLADANRGSCPETIIVWRLESNELHLISLGQPPERMHDSAGTFL